MAEGEIVGWHHWLNGHEFKQTLTDGEGQGRKEGQEGRKVKDRTRKEGQGRKDRDCMLQSMGSQSWTRLSN